MKIKALIIGFSHMHVNEVALYISEEHNFEIVGAADVPSTVEHVTEYMVAGKSALLKRIADRDKKSYDVMTI